MPEIAHVLVIAAPPEQVWPAQTTADGLAGVWRLGATAPEGDPGRLGAFTFRSRSVATKLETTTLRPVSRIASRAARSNAPGRRDGTTVTFDLAPQGDVTRLSFADEGFADAAEGCRKVASSWRTTLTV